MSHPPRRLLIILAKYPRAGQVKTRLAVSIGVEAATSLYSAFLADLAPRFMHGNQRCGFDICWVYTPDTPEFERMLANLCALPQSSQITFVGHAASNLAEHQVKQLQWAAGAGYQQAVIITTDTPHLSRTRVDDAFERLNDHDVVIGPCVDGGYYLLGVCQYWQVLDQVEMSTGHVTNDVIRNAQAAWLSVSLLEPMLDIDNEHDLNAFVSLMESSSGNLCPKTWSKLEELGLRQRILKRGHDSMRSENGY